MEYSHPDKTFDIVLRRTNCDYCDKETMQMRQRLPIPQELGGVLEFYQCFRCDMPLSNFSGDSLSEHELVLMSQYAPEEYRKRPLKYLGTILIKNKTI
jgi:hypothetical protein